MMALQTYCSNAHLFRNLAESRARARAQHDHFLRLAMDRYNSLSQAGAPTDQQSEALVAMLDQQKRQPPYNEHAPHLNSLRETVLQPGQTWCERARAALRAGGARELDAATQPNAAGQRRSIELHIMLQEAERVFRGLAIGLSDPSIIIDDFAASMADLCEWFARASDELRAVRDTLDAGADDGHGNQLALPAGAEAIDEHDAALLEFLNRSPTLRRKVSDVLPEKGPQDRKAVAKRLRKLADRTPPLVDYPKNGRSGVAILPAGAEALKRATAQTPR